MRIHGKVLLGASCMLNAPFIEVVLISITNQLLQPEMEKFSDLPFHPFFFNLVYLFYLLIIISLFLLVIYLNSLPKCLLHIRQTKKLQNDQTTA